MKYEVLGFSGDDAIAVRTEMVLNVAMMINAGWTPLGGISLSTNFHPVTLRIKYHLAQAMVKVEPEDLPIMERPHA